MIKYIKIGTIVNVHGLKGEVKVYPDTDDAKRFLELKDVFLGNNEKSLNTMNITNVRIVKGFPLVKFESINDRVQAESLRNKGLFIERNRLKLPEGRFLISDLIDMEVFENDVKLGLLKDVIKTGANDVYVIKENDGKELLLPAIKKCIINIDTKNNRMDVTLMEGLRDASI